MTHVRSVTPADGAAPPPAHAAPAPEPAPCGNCGAGRIGAYCHGCGQHFRDDRLTFRGILRELAERTNFERGLPRTFRELCTDPGGLVRRYVAGQRRTYTSPLAYLFVGATAMLLVWPLYADRARAMVGTRTDVDVSPGALFSPAQAEVYAELVQRVAEQTALGGLTMALPFALLVRLFFRRSGINIAEASVFSLFVFGHIYLVHSLTVPLMWLAGAGVSVYSGSINVVMLWVAGHAAAGYFARPVSSVLKSTLAVLGSFVIWATVVNGIMVTYVLLAH